MADGIAYAIAGSLLGFAQTMLEFGEELLDRIGGIWMTSAYSWPSSMKKGRSTT